jgi:hypothetical protein
VQQAPANDSEPLDRHVPASGQLVLKNTNVLKAEKIALVVLLFIPVV